MIYVKNVPGWERVVRIVMGMVALGAAYALWGVSTAGVVLAVAGAMFAMTGLMGFCPMCAMVGRKLKGH